MEELAGTRQDVWLRAADEIAALAAARGDGHDADPGAGIEVLRRYGLLAAPMRPEGAGYVYDFPWRLALPAFVALGGKALEASMAGMSPNDADRIASLCRRFKLHASMGSDFHDPAVP